MRYIGLIIGVFLLVSCKKDWSCDCKVTDQNGEIVELVGASPLDYNYKGITKKEAKAKCEKQQNTSMLDEAYIYTCQLKLVD